MCSRALAEYGIIVDNFHIKPVPTGSIFFLTHFHSDHTRGLTPKWNHSTIYTSQTVFVLMKLRYGKTAKLLNYVKPLSVFQWSVLPVRGQDIHVCCIPANHSTGSVMWCFILPNGSTVVHTGDFRPGDDTYHWEGWKRMVPVSMLFYDSSLYDPRIRIPSVEQSVQALEELYRTMGKNQNMAVLLHTSGMETLIVEWCKKYERSWHIDKSCKDYKELELGLMENGSLFRCHTSGRADITCVGEAFRTKHEGDKKWVFVKPSLVWFMCHRNQIDQNETYSMNHAIPDETNTFRILYSNHASYDEIQTFIGFLRPILTSECVESIIPRKKCIRTKSARPKWDYQKQLMEKKGGGNLIPFQSKNKKIRK